MWNLGSVFRSVQNSLKLPQIITGRFQQRLYSTVNVPPLSAVRNRRSVKGSEIAKTPYQVLIEAEEFLGPNRFSRKNGLSETFGRFREIISLFLLKVNHIDHPVLHLTKVVEAETHKGNIEEVLPLFPLWRSMVVMLATDMFGISKEMKNVSSETFDFMLERHKRVSLIAEIAYVTQLIHSRVINISDTHRVLPHGLPLDATSTKSIKELLADLHRANKATTLVGDLLLTQKCVQMAALKSSVATDVICSTLADYCEGEFTLGIEEPLKMKFSYDQWMLRTQLGISTLLRNMIYLNLHFSGFGDKKVNEASKIGTMFGYLLQAYGDLKFFEKDELKEPGWLNLNLLPVVLKCEKEPIILNDPFPKIFTKVKEDTEVMNKSLTIFHKTQDDTLDYLSKLKVDGDEKAKEILKDFVNSLKIE